MISNQKLLMMFFILINKILVMKKMQSQTNNQIIYKIDLQKKGMLTCSEKIE